MAKQKAVEVVDENETKLSPVETLKAKITKLVADQEAANIAAAERQRGEIAKLTEELGEAEQNEQRERDATIPGRLKAVLASMAAARQGDPAEEAEVQNDEWEEKELRRKAQPFLAAADHVETGLKGWSKEYLASFETLNSADREAYLRDMPSRSNREVTTSVALVKRLQNSLEQGLSLYHNSIQTQQRTRDELESLLSTGRFRLNDNEFEREFNQVVHEMAMINSDTVDTLHVFAGSVTKTLEVIATLKAQVSGTAQPPIRFTNPSVEMENVRIAEAMTRRGDDSGRPTREITGGPFDSVFGGDR